MTKEKGAGIPAKTEHLINKRGSIHHRMMYLSILTDGATSARANLPMPEPAYKDALLQKNNEKSRTRLHISKKSCNFACKIELLCPNYGNEP